MTWLDTVIATTWHNIMSWALNTLKQVTIMLMWNMQGTRSCLTTRVEPLFLYITIYSNRIQMRFGKNHFTSSLLFTLVDKFLNFPHIISIKFFLSKFRKTQYIYNCIKGTMKVLLICFEIFLGNFCNVYIWA